MPLLSLRNIFDEGYIEKGEGLRQKLIENPGLIKNYRRELKEMETEALEQMKGFYDQFEGELDGHALNADDLKIFRPKLFTSSDTFQRLSSAIQNRIR